MKTRIFAPKALPESLFFTSAIMLSAGLGFGLALRSTPMSPQSSASEIPSQIQTGGGLLRSEQNFPPRPDWNLDSEEEGENLDGSRYNSLQMQ